ncbi:hypothetical protein Moror_12220 [Moniliophthora roreri MCA 2997]|uniref:Uncharacterized protein n=1 Tax=Moniliophthora roreri (strain MCA 2997) TaxID=1381753 RepID=V2XSD9_MONRO|nr:hypothetical protein Moror_12220 [Moniliophthora roreri MCA 2997]
MPLKANKDWPDHDDWIASTKAILDFTLHASNNPVLTVCTTATNQLAEHMKKPLNYKHEADCNAAYEIYACGIKFLNDQIKTGVPEPAQLLKPLNICLFYTLCVIICLNCLFVSSGKWKAPKSPAIISDDTNEDNNDKVQIVTSSQEDTEMSEPKSLNASMHAPKKDKKSTNHLITAASIQADLRMTTSSKRTWFECTFTNLRKESSKERSLRIAGYKGIIKQSSLIPFIEMERMSLNVLQSITNFLCTELSTLEHNIYFWIAQYQLTHKKFEKANHV